MQARQQIEVVNDMPRHVRSNRSRPLDWPQPGGDRRRVVITPNDQNDAVCLKNRLAGDTTVEDRLFQPVIHSFGRDAATPPGQGQVGSTLDLADYEMKLRSSSRRAHSGNEVPEEADDIEGIATDGNFSDFGVERELLALEVAAELAGKLPYVRRSHWPTIGSTAFKAGLEIRERRIQRLQLHRNSGVGSRAWAMQNKCMAQIRDNGPNLQEYVTEKSVTPRIASNFGRHIAKGHDIGRRIAAIVTGEPHAPGKPAPAARAETYKLDHRVRIRVFKESVMRVTDRPFAQIVEDIAIKTDWPLRSRQQLLCHTVVEDEMMAARAEKNGRRHVGEQLFELVLVG